MWATDGQGVAAWVKVNFKKTVMVVRIHYRPRSNVGERIKSMLIQYDEGLQDLWILPNVGTIMKYEPEEAIETDWIRFEFKEVYGTLNNGGAWEILGLPC